MFRPGNREQLYLRMALDGPSGSGKTYTAMRFAFRLAGGGKVAVIDTERRSAEKYLGESPDGIPWEFDVCPLEHFAPTTYTHAIREAQAQGYSVLVIDSLSHAWEGEGGALDLVDKKGGNSFTAWKDVTPLHREMIDAITSAQLHVIVTMRTKTEYVLEADSKGKMVPKKVGMAPVQRQGMEYEFDVVCDLDLTHQLKVSKTRCRAIDQATMVNPSPEFLTPVINWLTGKPTSNHQQTNRKEGDDVTQVLMASPLHRETMIQWASTLGKTPADIAGIVQKRAKSDGTPCQKIYDLTAQQAEEIIAKMKELYYKQNPEKPVLENDEVPF